jgi:hypothetical protein
MGLLILLSAKEKLALLPSELFLLEATLFKLGPSTVSSASSSAS